MNLEILGETGRAPKGGRHPTICFDPLRTLLVKCPSAQWQPDGLTIHTNKWFLGAGFLGAPPISLNKQPLTKRALRSASKLNHTTTTTTTTTAAAAATTTTTIMMIIIIMIIMIMTIMIMTITTQTMILSLVILVIILVAT